MAIGDIIKTERKLKKLSQEQLAQKIGVTQDSISLWETNKRIPDTPYIIELCKALNISADYLLGLEDETGTKTYSSKNHIENINNYGKIDIK